MGILGFLELGGLCVLLGRLKSVRKNRVFLTRRLRIVKEESTSAFARISLMFEA